MPLQNRVTPFGAIVATPERGTMLGNRGVLHDDQRRLVRPWRLRRWICCVLEFKGIRRTVMSPRRWTELFFLDEATAFAAGHRPCFECRRASALAYQSAWARAFEQRKPPMADEMDCVLDADRRESGRGAAKKTHAAEVSALPDGVFFAREGVAWLVHAGRRLRWTAGGYAESAEIGAGVVDVLTPRATVAVIRAGYAPAVHESARARDRPPA